MKKLKQLNMKNYLFITLTMLVAQFSFSQQKNEAISAAATETISSDVIESGATETVSNENLEDAILESNTQETPYSYLNKVKRFSIGAKIGIPNIVTGGIEYNLPFLNNHFAPYIDYTKINYNQSGESFSGSLSYSEFGLNYYFNQKGKGFYLGAGISNFSIKGVDSEIELDEATGRTGTADTNFEFSGTALKLGVKTGGTFYVRFEVGYSFGSFPIEIIVRAVDNSDSSLTEVEVVEIPGVPGISESGIVVANLGFGFSF
ncbi:MAG: hypothetical protein QNL21_07365 [Flavobacteriales bacterium]